MAERIATREAVFQFQQAPHKFAIYLCTVVACWVDVHIGEVVHAIEVQVVAQVENVPLKDKRLEARLVCMTAENLRDVAVEL